MNLDTMQEQMDEIERDFSLKSSIARAWKNCDAEKATLDNLVLLLHEVGSTLTECRQTLARCWEKLTELESSNNLPGASKDINIKPETNSPFSRPPLTNSVFEERRYIQTKLPMVKINRNGLQHD